MRTLTTFAFRSISKTEIENLTNIIQETIAPTQLTTQNRSFGVVDLWNIQRRSKTAGKKRNSAW